MLAIRNESASSGCELPHTFEEDCARRKKFATSVRVQVTDACGADAANGGGATLFGAGGFPLCPRFAWRATQFSKGRDPLISWHSVCYNRGVRGRATGASLNVRSRFIPLSGPNTRDPAGASVARSIFTVPPHSLRHASGDYSSSSECSPVRCRGGLESQSEPIEHGDDGVERAMNDDGDHELSIRTRHTIHAAHFHRVSPRVNESA